MPRLDLSPGGTARLLKVPGIPGVTAKLETGLPAIVPPITAENDLNALAGLGQSTGLQRLGYGIKQFTSQPAPPVRTIRSTLPKLLKRLGTGLP